MNQAIPTPEGPCGVAGSDAVYDPAVAALTSIVRTYSPSQAWVFRPDHWTGLQPDTYAMRRAHDALADRTYPDLEQRAIDIAAEAIAISPELRSASSPPTVTPTTRQLDRDQIQGVSWIMNATTVTSTLAAACRLLAQAATTDRYLRHQRPHGSS